MHTKADLVGQGLRYALAGVTVTCVYLLSTLTLADALGLPFQEALAIGFALALCAHFTLQRLFVWPHPEARFALPFHHQIARYLLLAGGQYGVTAAAVALLPTALGLPVEVVYLVTVALSTSANFVVFRYGVFHAAAATPQPAAKSA